MSGEQAHTVVILLLGPTLDPVDVLSMPTCPLQALSPHPPRNNNPGLISDSKGYQHCEISMQLFNVINDHQFAALDCEVSVVMGNCTSFTEITQ